MSEERRTVEVGIAEKGTAPDDAEITKLAKPEEDDVGGRYRTGGMVECPYCHVLCRIDEETEYRKWFQCWNCYNNFQY
jgi:hypothetical protein